MYRACLLALPNDVMYESTRASTAAELCLADVAESRQRVLSEALERAPSKSFLDAMFALNAWMEQVEALQQAHAFHVDAEAVLSQQIAKFKVTPHGSKRDSYVYCLLYVVVSYSRSILPSCNKQFLSACLQELQTDVHDHEVSLEYVNDTGRALVQKGGERGDQLKADLAQLNHRFDATARAIDERLTLLESSVEQLAQMNVR